MRCLHYFALASTRGARAKQSLSSSSEGGDNNSDADLPARCDDLSWGLPFIASCSFVSVYMHVWLLFTIYRSFCLSFSLSACLSIYTRCVHYRYSFIEFQVPCFKEITYNSLATESTILFLLWHLNTHLWYCCVSNFSDNNHVVMGGDQKW